MQKLTACADMGDAMDQFNEVGSVIRHGRYKVPAPENTSKPCRCGCGTRATHIGMANGVALMTGCEWHVRRWVKHGLSIYRKE